MKKILLLLCCISYLISVNGASNLSLGAETPNAATATPAAAPTAITATTNPSPTKSADTTTKTSPVSTKADPPAKTADPTAKPEIDESQEVWELLLQNRISALNTINTETQALIKNLPQASRQLNRDLNQLNKEYDRIVTIASVSRGLPLELSIVLINLQNLQTRLTQILSPLEGSLSALKTRLEDISLLEKDTPIDKDEGIPELRLLLKDLEQTQDRLNDLQVRINGILSPARKLNQNINNQKERLSKVLPDLWQDYYLKRTSRLYEPASWQNFDLSLNVIKETYSIRLNAELPQTWSEWFSTFIRGFIFLTILTLAKVGSQRLAQSWPPMLRDGWLRLSKHSLNWLIWGFVFEAIAWSQTGGSYHFFNIFGTLLLSLGQMALTWDLYTFDRTDLPTKSPLWPLFVPLLCGLILLLFNLPGMILSCIWLIILSITIYFDRKRTLPDIPYPLILFCLKAHTFILYLAIFMTLLGYGRLSILVCMIYIAIVVCIQQVIGFMRLTNIISANLPQEGVKGLVWGGILALALPAILLLATLAIGLWIFAYPGGTYLFSQVTSMDVSIGETTFNFIQILLILSVFYVTKTIISVGKFFIKELPTRGIRLESNLIGPFQIIFTYTLWGIFVLYTLSTLGFSLTSLAVVAGGLSVGIGFGLQNIINNFISGLLMIFGQTLREGDIIEVGQNLTGTVKKISIRSTMVETFDNATIFVPNSEFLSSRLTNWTRNGRMVRREIKLGVAYGSDVKKVIAILKELATNHPKVLVYPEPIVNFADFGASSLDFALQFWIADISSGLSITTELRLEISSKLAEENIEISFPQLDVHLKTTG